MLPTNLVSSGAYEDSLYTRDAELRRIAVSKTKCFSSHEETDPACSGCLLVSWCVEGTQAKMEELARTLDSQETYREPPPPVTYSKGSSRFVGSLLRLEEALQKAGYKATCKVISFRVTCSLPACGGEHKIEGGSNIIHILGVGMFAPECASKLLSTQKLSA